LERTKIMPPEKVRELHDAVPDAVGKSKDRMPR
jgi:hypothetical protein